jgi:hypothetical protein
MSTSTTEVPFHLQELPADASLGDVVRAIDEDRARKRAIYLAPSIRWSDSRGSSIEIVESSSTL